MVLGIKLTKLPQILTLKHFQSYLEKPLVKSNIPLELVSWVKPWSPSHLKTLVVIYQRVVTYYYKLLVYIYSSAVLF